LITNNHRSELLTMAPMNYADLNGCTVYVQRIFPERLNSKNQIDKLTETIRACFEDYGTILDIIVKRSLHRKGQAFVVFDNAESAATAQEELDGFELAPDSPITTSIAKTPSDATVEKFCTPEEFKTHKEKRLAEKGTRSREFLRETLLTVRLTERKNAELEAQRALLEAETKKRPAEEAPSAPTNAIRPIKALKSTSKQTVIPSEYLPPNKLIMVDNVPSDYDKDMLTPIFSQFEGLVEVRVVTVGRNKGLVFVEYANIAGATAAKDQLNNSRLGEKLLKITYGKDG
jgi:U2 small nuclear ribonucleoprotein B''